MAVRIRHHVNPLRPALRNIAPARLDLAALGTGLPDAPMDVELGCADAQFLFQLAAQDRSTNYIGVEIRQALVDDVNRRASEAGLPHLRAVFAHINIDLPSLFAGHRVRRFYINFPDPWFKRAQHNRRIVTPELACELAQLIAPDGEIFFQSDVFDLALDALAVLEAEPTLCNAHEEWRFWGPSPYPAQSLREERVTASGLPVWRMLFVRRDAPATRLRRLPTPGLLRSSAPMAPAP